MRFLFIHNTYQISGGEDLVFNNEVELLRQNGHIVDIYQLDNASIHSFFSKIWTSINLVFSYGQFRKVIRRIESNRPDIIHVHNFFPLFTPSVFYAAKKMKVPIVHTLHNYRTVCPTAILMHEGKIEERSIKHSSWWALGKKAYRNSWIGSLALLIMVDVHKKIGTWQKKVDRFIALTDFSKAKFIEAGWPENKISVKANFINDPYPACAEVNRSGGYAIYLGRLSPEKGIEVLLEAWQHINFTLKIIGGDDSDQVPNSLNLEVKPSSIGAKSGTTPRFLGIKEKQEVFDLVKNADFVIMPSLWYETFGMVIIEAFACGTPVICSRLGSLVNLVEEGVTGIHFKAGNAQDLSKKVKWMISNPKEMRKMGENARQAYLENYTPEKNYAILMDIYHQAIEEAKKV